MLVMTGKTHPKNSLEGRFYRCEINVMDTKLHIKYTFVGATFKEALDAYLKDVSHIRVS